LTGTTDIFHRKYRSRPLRQILALACVLLVCCSAAPARTEAVTVFAAVSLQDALRALGEAWGARGRPAPRFAFAASSALARQIEQGAPADLFLSADEAWMDYLAERGLLAGEGRTSRLANRLVLIAPADAARSVPLTRSTDLAALLGPRDRLATGDPAHVPVGRYARAALEWLGQWPALEPRLARADNVRAALLLVARGEAALGIVYASDALAEARVRVVGTFPAESHPPIRYPFALTARAQDRAAAMALLAFLSGPEAAPTWLRFGFGLVP